MIVETEAYRGPHDRAHIHTEAVAPNDGNDVWAGRHRLRLLRIRMYNQFNVVTNVKDAPQAVLIRALEPVEG